MKTQLISALCTMMNDDDSLCAAGMQRHLRDQWAAGIGGVLIAGTMGQMQMLPDRTYRDVVACGVEASAGRGEVMVGVGDLSLPRTLDRIAYAQQFDIDALVALTPGFVPHSQAELIAYFSALADAAEKPLCLYDFPLMAGNELAIDTILELSRHPNIAGLKISVPWDKTRQVMDLADEGFRIIPAQPFLVDQLARLGVASNLDGIYALFPRCFMRIVAAVEAGEFDEAARQQAQLSAVLRHLRGLPYSGIGWAGVILTARGIPGKTACLPAGRPNTEETAAILAEPIIRDMIEAEGPAPE